MESTHNIVADSDARAVVQAGRIDGGVHLTLGTQSASAYLRDPERWPTAASWDALAAGAHRARTVPDGSDMPPYVPRDIDAELRARIEQVDRHGGLVVVRGNSAAGKTRAAFEAVRAILPGHRVAVPTTGTDLPVVLEAISGSTARYVLWLNNLEVFLGPGGFDQNLLADCERLRLPVVATIRRKPFDIFISGAREDDLLASGSSMNQKAQIAAHVLGAVDPVDLSRRWSKAEVERARALDDEVMADAVAHHGLYGIAEYLAAGPAIWSAWRQADDVDGSPRGAALVWAAVDLARSGLAGPYAEELIVELHEHYLAERGGRRLRPEPLEEALAWATRVRLGTTSPLLPADEELKWDVFEYLVDGVEQLTPVPPVPEVVWRSAVKHATDGFDAMNIAVRAAEAGTPTSYQIAEAIWRPLSNAGIEVATFNLGVLCWANDRWEEDRTLFRIGAEAGEARAAFNLSLMLEKDGAADEARTWRQVAVDAEYPAALFNLGLELEGQGRLDEAEALYRRGAELGEFRAATNLGNIMSQTGRLDEALPWYRQADKAGDAQATFNIGLFHHDAGRNENAMKWYRTAVQRGSAEAAMNLGVLLVGDERPAEAEVYYRKAVEMGLTVASHGLGRILEKRGLHDEAETWYRHGAEAGHETSVQALFRVLYDSERFEEAATLMQQAAETGDRQASAALGELLNDLGRADEAIPHLVAAAEAGLSDAAYNLGVISVHAGRLDQAKRWYRQAADSGDAEAASHLADVLFQEGSVASAIWWNRRSRDLRSTAAQVEIANA